jgi:hypothetical protein
MSTENQRSDEICCPEFNPVAWNEVTHSWKEKMFIRDKVSTIFYMPLNFSTVMVRLNKAMEGAGATSPDWLCLSDHRSKWSMELHLAVDKEITGAQNVRLSGEFFSKVYEGPFKDSGKWAKDFDQFARNRGLNLVKKFFWYTTCPKCAKKYGKNYVVIIGQLG